jgi:hypothetical protein
MADENVNRMEGAYMAEHDAAREAFSDPRKILVRANDARCMSCWDEEQAGNEQHEDGPTYIVIGRFAPDDALNRLARRYGFPVEQLQAFRDEQQHDVRRTIQLEAGHA